MKIDIFPGTKVDTTYLESMEKENKKNDLKLADLEYLKIEKNSIIKIKLSKYLQKYRELFPIFFRIQKNFIFSANI